MSIDSVEYASRSLVDCRLRHLARLDRIGHQIGKIALAVELFAGLLVEPSDDRLGRVHRAPIRHDVALEAPVAP